MDKELGTDLNANSSSPSPPSSSSSSSSSSVSGSASASASGSCSGSVSSPGSSSSSSSVSASGSVFDFGYAQNEEFLIIQLTSPLHDFDINVEDMKVTIKGQIGNEEPPLTTTLVLNIHQTIVEDECEFDLDEEKHILHLHLKKLVPSNMDIEYLGDQFQKWADGLNKLVEKPKS